MADVGTGGSVTFGTSTYTASWTTIEWDEVTREIIDTTHLGTTAAKTNMPGDLIEPGGVTLTMQWDPDSPPPYTAAQETITITYPVPSGSSSGATLAGNGCIDSWTPGNMTVDALMESTVHIKYSGALTQADAS